MNLVTLQMTAGGQPVTGTNIISIIPGSAWGTKEDKVLVVGAHWDTVVASPGRVGTKELEQCKNKLFYTTVKSTKNDISEVQISGIGCI